MVLRSDFWDVLKERARQETEARWNAQGFCEARLKPVLAGQIQGFKIKNSDLNPGAGIEDHPQTPVVCGWDVTWGYSGWVVRLSNGVTGWEGWYVRDLIDFGIYESDNPYVCACAGTPNRWDALYVDRAQLIEACQQAQQLIVFNPQPEA